MLQGDLALYKENLFFYDFAIACERPARANVLRTLESSGRVKDISFSNDATAAHIQDTLLHNFPNHLTRENISR